MFKNLFGGKKDAYFLELDENKSQQPAKDKTEAPAKPVEEKKAESSQASEVKSPKAAPVEAKKTKKTSVKNNGQNAEAAPEPTPKASAPAASDPEAIIRAAVFKKDSNGKVGTQTVQFADKYLMMPTMSRRKPGPSLDMFKNMARQVKVPKKG
ncbi:MAG: hypothetical protein IGR93_02595 [Hydrococcus sp. C42_A2020_068]|nr:hypothetical protein [Hydrococcus sp. C42_A2020_068]